ncbi:MAG: AbrB/MazE/SpoVT family DNA-binding domain-containing protein [Deltaproteobacteria bacterium]|nr:AbrB/MazE/SpoVT family DNA-binding domain-containing protein [Deltaproteobacteria bacterium]
MSTATTKLGKRGTVVIPAAMRKKYGFEEGALLIAESVPEGVLFRPVVTLPVEIYSAERKAEFLLNNTTTLEDYDGAIKEVRKMGLDPETIPHRKPEVK